VPCEAVAGGDKPVWNAELDDDIASTEAGFKYRVGFFNDAIAPTGKRSNRSGFFVFNRIALEG
jgi:hypothetical protein